MQAPGLFDTPDKRGKYGLVHNIGLGGAVVCSLLRRPEFYAEGGDDGRARCVFPASSKRTLNSHLCFHRTHSAAGFYFCPFDAHAYRLGYNHAHECRPITRADVDKVKAKKSSPYVLGLARL